MSRPSLRAALGVAAALGGLFLLTSDMSTQLWLNLTVTGLTFGGVFALSGLGIVLTYKATGVFNFAHGAIAMIVAYVFWQLGGPWGWPKWLAATTAILLVGPLIGVVLELAVFRRLQRRGAGTAEKLVRTLAVFIVLVGLAFLVWTGQTRTDIPELFPTDRIEVALPGDLTIGLGVDQLAVLAIVALSSAALWWLFTFTFLGIRIRATVDRRDLAELAAIDADRVAAVAWSMGTAFAGLTGVLLATTRGSLDPIRFTLLVIETFAVAVLARLTSLPVAVGGGLFIGLLAAYTQGFSFASLAEPFTSSPTAQQVAEVLDPILPSIAVFVLFGALLTYRKLQSAGADDAGSFLSRSQVAANPVARRLAFGVGTVLAVALPVAGLGPTSWPTVHEAVALAIVFVSIVAVTGFSGHITLGQAAFAGFGAFLTGRLAAGTFFGLPALPTIPAMLVAGLLCVLLGFVAGYPALRRRGLFLGLTTLALGLVVSRFVFQNSFFVSGIDTLLLERPSTFAGDTAFYYYELVVLGGAVFLARNLRAGALGRTLGAMRDSETATRSMGISLRRYKLFIFSVSAFLAGIGGSLLGQGAGAFSHEQFNPIVSLIWFMIVVVAGVASISGAVLAAFLITVLGLLVDEPGAAQFLIGAAALVLPEGGLIGALRRLTGAGTAPRWLRAAYASAHEAPAGRRPPPTAPTATDAAGPAPAPSPFARHLLAAAEREP